MRRYPYVQSFIIWEMRHVDFERAYYEIKEIWHG